MSPSLPLCLVATSESSPDSKHTRPAGADQPGLVLGGAGGGKGFWLCPNRAASPGPELGARTMTMRSPSGGVLMSLGAVLNAPFWAPF